MRREVRGRFYEKFVRDANECWLWIGGKIGGGFGFTRNKESGNKAHRLSWIIHRGPIPNGLWVLHKCDVRLCVNPDHLFLGNQSDNMFDMHAKKRHAASAKTKCNAGHDLFGSNLRIVRVRNRTPYRTCRICTSAASRRHYQKTGTRKRSSEYWKAVNEGCKEYQRAYGVKRRAVFLREPKPRRSK